MLAALGYKSEFKREFSLFTTFCVSFAVLGLLPSFASTLSVLASSLLFWVVQFADQDVAITAWDMREPLVRCLQPP